jgi:hypothetical protein
MKVKDVLESYVSGIQMGEQDPPRVSDVELTQGLSTVSHTNHVYFQLCFAALLLVFTGSCVLVATFLNDPRRLGALFAVTGVSIVGLIAQMVALRKQKVTADLITVLARSLRPGDVRGVIEVLFAKL